MWDFFVYTTRLQLCCKLTLLMSEARPCLGLHPIQPQQEGEDTLGRCEFGLPLGLQMCTNMPSLHSSPSSALLKLNLVHLYFAYEQAVHLGALQVQVHC